jgi:RNA polymerase sigma-70 factor (ECF subfamily)
MEKIAIARESGELDESTLIARVLDGDRVAGRVLYDVHAPRVYRLIYRIAGDADLAQELTQEAFVRAFSRLDRFRGDAAFSTWIHRIALSVALNGMRKVKRFRSREMPLDDAAPIASRSDSIDPDLRERVASEIDKLPEAQRVTLIMHDLEGYTHAEIAAALRVPEGTCKTRLSGARARLRHALRAFATE